MPAAVIFDLFGTLLEILRWIMTNACGLQEAADFLESSCPPLNSLSSRDPSTSKFNRSPHLKMRCQLSSCCEIEEYELVCARIWAALIARQSGICCRGLMAMRSVPR